MATQKYASLFIIHYFKWTKELFFFPATDSTLQNVKSLITYDIYNNIFYRYFSIFIFLYSPPCLVSISRVQFIASLLYQLTRDAVAHNFVTYRAPEMDLPFRSVTKFNDDSVNK
jgi:hypothetical protein